VNKDLEAGDKIEYNQNDIDEIQDGYKLIKYGLIVAWIIIGIGLILLMMLSQKRHVKNIFILTPIFLVAGMLTLIPVIVTYVGFGYINDDIRSEIYEDFSNDPNTEEIGKLIYRIVENFSMNFMETLLFGALLVLGIGIVLALIWIAMPNGSKKPKVENSKTETEPSTEPMVN
jgi:mannose/fructose/N-acetylgalactosamine-specific phosphotransferase system component IIC